jgi:TolB-like protein/Flp pilus assembly protein TadD
MSEKKDQEFLADGIADEILNLLAKAPDLLVSARTSSFYFKGKPTKIPEIAHELGVAHVLEGSIRRAGDQLRVTAQLVRAETGYHLWSETYNRELRDVFDVRTTLRTRSRRCCRLSSRAGGELQRRKGGTQNLEAYQLYLRAESDVNIASRESLPRAQTLLERALELDPSYGLASWALADAFALKAEYGIEVKENYARVRDLAQRALELSPETPRVATVLHKNVDHDWKAWDLENKRALAIDPTDPATLQSAALLAMTLGRWDEAERQLRKALTRNPLDNYVHWTLGANHYGAGGLREAEDVLRKLLEMSPEFPWTRPYLAKTLMAQGRLEEALVVVEEDPEKTIALISLPVVLDRLGRRAEADEALKAQIAQWGDTNAYPVAGTYANRGDHATALQWLERAYDQYDSGLNEILSEPVFRTAPYRGFLRKMNLADAADRLAARAATTDTRS